MDRPKLAQPHFSSVCFPAVQYDTAVSGFQELDRIQKLARRDDDLTMHLQDVTETET